MPLDFVYKTGSQVAKKAYCREISHIKTEYQAAKKAYCREISL